MDIHQNIHKYFGQLAVVDFHQSNLVKNLIDQRNVICFSEKLKNWVNYNSFKKFCHIVTSETVIVSHGLSFFKVYNPPPLPFIFLHPFFVKFHTFWNIYNPTLNIKPPIQQNFSGNPLLQTKFFMAVFSSHSI